LALRTKNPIDHIVILTGAGISAESGIATFRDADGLWENHDPMEIATPEAFASNPGLVYRFYNSRRRKLVEAQPNAAHRALARLEREFTGTVFLVTQNVDDLHERAGCGQVCHMHGELAAVLCQHCGESRTTAEDYDDSSSCPGCDKQGGLRPDVVWFGEMPYHMGEIEQHISRCDLFVAIGTSGVVYPAAGFVQEALRWGAHTVEINKELSEVTGLFHEQRQGLATEEVEKIVGELLAGH
jgi:NAD-dependent protein deacetylase/lipoamidase